MRYQTLLVRIGQMFTFKLCCWAEFKCPLANFVDDRSFVLNVIGEQSLDVSRTNVLVGTSWCPLTNFVDEHSSEYTVKTLLSGYSICLLANFIDGHILWWTLSTVNPGGGHSSEVHCQTLLMGTVHCLLVNFVGKHSSDVHCQTSDGEHSSDINCQNKRVGTTLISADKLCWWAQFRCPQRLLNSIAKQNFYVHFMSGGHISEVHSQTLMVSKFQMSIIKLLVRKVEISVVKHLLQGTAQRCTDKLCWYIEFRCSLLNFVGDHRSEFSCQTLLVCRAQILFDKLCWSIVLWGTLETHHFIFTVSSTWLIWGCFLYHFLFSCTINHELP